MSGFGHWVHASGGQAIANESLPPGSLALDSKAVESAAASSRSRDSRIGIARSPADSDELLPIPKGSVRIVRNPFDVAGFLGTPKHPLGFSKAPKYP